MPTFSVRHLRIPFKVAFSHGSATRVETQSVWCEVEGEGHRGVGEGCPREYVTGESVESALAFVHECAQDALRHAGSVDELRGWVRSNEAVLDLNPAAWCALELAILDWLARRGARSVEALLGLASLRGRFTYTAVLGDMDRDPFERLARVYREQGFTDFKLKLSGDPDRDARRLRIVGALGIEGVRVRVDANNLFADPDAALEHVRALRRVGPLAGVEEPIAAGDFQALAALATASAVPVILDETCLRADHVRAAARHPDRFILNLRVSKMGGLLRSLDVVAAARAAGVPAVVGAQVGETSVLTRAALPVARALGDLLFAQEGAFGTRLIEHDVIDPPLMFGAAGVVDADAHALGERPGFGLEGRGGPGPGRGPAPGPESGPDG